MPCYSERTEKYEIDCLEKLLCYCCSHLPLKYIEKCPEHKYSSQGVETIYNLKRWYLRHLQKDIDILRKDYEINNDEKIHKILEKQFEINRINGEV